MKFIKILIKFFFCKMLNNVGDVIVNILGLQNAVNG
jgi:hypothetical protein